MNMTLHLKSSSFVLRTHHPSNSYTTFKLGLNCIFPKGTWLLSTSQLLSVSDHMGCPCPRKLWRLLIFVSWSLQFIIRNCTGYSSWGLTNGWHSSLKIFSPLLKILHCLHCSTMLTFLISSSWLSLNQTFSPLPLPDDEQHHLLIETIDPIISLGQIHLFYLQQLPV